jgi:hypothetical protein
VGINERGIRHAPPTYKRILLLRQIEQEIQSRGVETTNIYAKI